MFSARFRFFNLYLIVLGLLTCQQCLIPSNTTLRANSAAASAQDDIFNALVETNKTFVRDEIGLKHFMCVKMSLFLGQTKSIQ